MTDYETILRKANDILNTDGASESDLVLLEEIAGRPVTDREKRMATVLSHLYRLIHPVFSTCTHEDWKEENGL